MSVCARCGHGLVVGRFCTNCGHPVGAPVPDPDDWRTGTAERPAVPEAAAVDGGVDGEDGDTAVLPTGTHRAAGARTVPWLSWLPWLVGALALLLVAGLGAWLMFAGDDEPVPGPAASSPTGRADEPGGAPPTSATAPTTAPTDPAGTAGRPTEVAGEATVTVPATAPPNQDVAGNPVTYEGTHLLDGEPETCWRMPGDGTGETLTFTLAGPTRLTSVGLVNGYAKTATDGGRNLDWYAGNRRVLAVVWEFDDGTTVSQDLEETRDLQTVEVDVTTETVELTLVTVSEPGTGPSRRDYTAISEVSFLGSPG